MHKPRLFKTVIMIVTVLFMITNGTGLAFASESFYEIYQRDGSLRLIVKFKDFVSDSISFKLGERELVRDTDLDEYILI